MEFKIEFSLNGDAFCRFSTIMRTHKKIKQQNVTKSLFPESLRLFSGGSRISQRRGANPKGGGRQPII